MKQPQNIGTMILQTVLSKPKNISIIEAYVDQHSQTNEEYMYMIYDCVGEIIQNGTGKDELRSIVENICNGRYAWNHPMFDEIRMSMHEEDHILDDMVFEEGALDCYRCNSKKTISYQRQTRSADEGATTFARCTECNYNWRHNN